MAQYSKGTDNCSGLSLEEFTSYLKDFLPYKESNLQKFIAAISKVALLGELIERAAESIPGSHKLNAFSQDLKKLMDMSKAKSKMAFPKLSQFGSLTKSFVMYVFKGATFGEIIEKLAATSTLRKSLEDSQDDDVREVLGLIQGILCTGSTFDGLQLPPMLQNGKFGHLSDIDIMFVLGNTVVVKDVDQNALEKMQVKLDFTSVHPGYTKLMVVKFPKENPPKMVWPTIRSWNRYEEKQVDYLFSNLIAASESGVKSDIPDRIARACVNGPAFTLECPKVLGTSSLTFDVHMDFVLSIKCPMWPIAASDWVTRARPSGWPDKKLIEHITSLGCHVVPTSHTESEEKDIEWRFSFSLAERELTKSFNKPQRHLYKILKVVHKHQWQKFGVLSSYHLKTVMFWVCEKIPPHDWTKKNLAFCFFTLLDELHECLNEHYLRNYFVPENNLIDYFDRDLVQDSAAIIGKMRKDPLYNLTTCQDKYHLREAPHFNPVTHLFFQFMQFNPFCKDQDFKFEHQVERATSGMVAAAAENLADSNLSLGNMDEAIDNYLELIKMKKEFEGDKDLCELVNRPLTSHMNRLALKIRISSSKLKFYEKLIDRFNSPPDVTNFIAKKGWILFQKNCSHSGSTDEAEALFQSAFNFRKISPVALVDYSAFLCHEDRHADAIPHIRKSIDIAARYGANEEHFFSEWENMGSDVHIKRLLKLYGRFTIPTLLYAYYLLVQCNQKTDKPNEELKKILEEFEELSDHLQCHDKSVAKALLGVSFIKTGPSCLDSAMKAFALTGKDRILEIVGDISPIMRQGISRFKVAKEFVGGGFKRLTSK